ncbi:MAG TPA: DUF3857 domain-containing protein [Cyclobacteriaceae bacterium]|nr:DUF3857 domain-containing protein [Cyclobacteriaceae bacterium]
MKKILLLLFISCQLSSLFAAPPDRAEELREEMWNSGDKNFAIKDIPQNWAGKSAVIIAQMNRFEYRKVLMAKLLKENNYAHYRIRLNDKNAVDKYSEMSFDVSSLGYNVFVGYKVIKPNGKETIVDISKAVKMERTVNGRKQAYNKIAIPGLEPGDILDYYLCTEETQDILSYILFFQPVIYSIPDQYPIMNYKIQFRASRKCYINIKSVNGAPEFKLITDEKNDEEYYSIEGSNMESVEDQRWIYKYRELPTIKFRAAYSVNEGMAEHFDVLLGEVKKAKTSVSKQELTDLTQRMSSGSGGYYDLDQLKKYDKASLKDVTDPFQVATKAYYYLRNELYFKYAEPKVWEGNEDGTIRESRFLPVFHQFLKKKKIEHDVIVGASREISRIDDIIMENELDWLIRVKKGKDYLYLSPFDAYTLPGTFSESLEGTEAYAFNGLESSSKWIGEKITLPVLTSTDHQAKVNVQVQITDMSKAKLTVKKDLMGRNKLFDQYSFIDYYDYEKEENAKFTNEPIKRKKQELALKKAYMDQRDTRKTDALKRSIEEDYEFKIENPGNIVIEQTGRYDDAPAMKYGYTFETDALMKKTGPHYLMDAGKLIEAQVKIDGEELARKTNVYFSNARSFVNTIAIDIPQGYTVEGVDKLTTKVQHKSGGFTSTAKVQGGKVLIETNKYYSVNYVPKDQWKNVVEFLNAAYNFSEMKLLFKKK